MRAMVAHVGQNGSTSLFCFYVLDYVWDHVHDAEAVQGTCIALARMTQQVFHAPRRVVEVVCLMRLHYDYDLMH